MGLDGFFDGYGTRSRNGRWTPWPMSQSWLGVGPRLNLGLLILSPVLFFQRHTASEPLLGTLLCARLLSLPQSHPWSFQDMGTNHSFPARVPLSLLSSRPVFVSLSCCLHHKKSFPGCRAWVCLSSKLIPFSRLFHWDGEDVGYSTGPTTYGFIVYPEKHSIILLIGAFEPGSTGPCEPCRR